MTRGEKVKYWLDLSDEDLRVGQTMLRNGHWLYTGFMCHQGVEKILKGLYAKIKDGTPPYRHDLPFLAQQSGIYEALPEEQKLWLNELNPLNIEARYPAYKNRLADSLNREKSERLMAQTQRFQQWIKEKILSIK